MTHAAMLLGRLLLALLFAGGAVQKALSPQDAQALLQGAGLPAMWVWLALIANAMGAFCLVSGFWLAPAALGLAVYCGVTSFFHLLPSDPWQMTIFIKNWAIAGGLLVLFAHSVEQSKTNT